MELETQVSPVVETLNNAPVTDEAEQSAQEPVTPADEAPKADETPDDPRDKTVKSLQRRIDRLTAAKYQTLAEANQARQQMEQLQARLAQYEQPQEPQQPQVDPISLAKEIAKIEKVTAKANEVAKTGAAKFQNFNAAVQTINREAGPMFDQYGRATPLGEVLLSADDPASVMHHIGSDPDLAAELADMTPIQQARRIARLEVELSKPKEPPKSSAPKPLEAIKGKSSGEKDPAQMSDREFAEWRKRQIAQRR